MKRTFALLFVLLLVLSPQMVFASGEDTKVQLSSLSEEECRQFLLERGVSIPEGMNINLSFVLTKLEEDPDYYFVIRTREESICLKEIRAVVREYCGISDSAQSYAQRSSTGPLLYSDLYSWDPDAMSDYNCYAFAIGRTDDFFTPGDFSGGTYNEAGSITSAAHLVVDDLHTMGKNCVKMENTLTTSLADWNNIIAIRKDTTWDAKDMSGEPMNDFHFAKLTSAGWLHKPGGTAVLKFRNAPSNSEIWTNENCDGFYHPGYVTYDSSIVYLSYKTNHNITTRYAGEHSHSGVTHWFLYEDVCTDCGSIIGTEWAPQPCSGPPCSFGILRREITETI